MESGEKTEVRSWKLEVESQKPEVGSRKSEVGGRTEICNVRNVRCNSQVRRWKSEVVRLSSPFAITNWAILVHVSFPYLQGFQVFFPEIKRLVSSANNMKDSKLEHVWI